MFDTILDYVRAALYTALIVLGFFMYQAWDKDQQVQIAANAAKTQQLAVQTSSNRVVPTEIPATAAAAAPLVAALPNAPDNATAAVNQQGTLVAVTTDLMEATIDTLGGEIVSLKLLKYPESLDSKQAFLLLNDQAKTRYLAESGLLSTEGPDTSKQQALYSVASSHYALAPNENQVTVVLNWRNPEGLVVNKVFTFLRNSYEINVRYDVTNHTPKTWQGHLYAQLDRTDVAPISNSGFMSLATYFGAAISSPEKHFQKVTFKDMQSQEISQSIQGGWAAMVQHYFVSAWIPSSEAVMNYYSKVSPNGLYTIGMMSAPITVAKDASASSGIKLYAGPAITHLLEKAAPGLQLTIDYGWFWFISVIIFWLMQHIHDVIGNWGWSIVLVTVLIKLLFYQLSAKSYRSMSALKRLQPQINALKERFGGDKQKMTQATLELYRQEKVNPMSGCFPILIQIPVFIALYWVLVASVELRQAPFIFWIRDLSQHDPYYVLAVLMGISMFFQQRLNPPPADPLQAKVMMMMPVLFTVLFANFPAGLLLYWVVNNTLSFLQQWYIMHQLDKEMQLKPGVKLIKE